MSNTPPKTPLRQAVEAFIESPTNKSNMSLIMLKHQNQKPRLQNAIEYAFLMGAQWRKENPNK